MLKRTDPNVPPVILAEKTGLDELLGGGQDILTNVSSALSPENIAALTKSLANIQKITDKLAESDGVIDNANITLKSINRAVVSIDAAAKTFNTDFHSLATKADGALTDVSPAIADIRNAMKNINGAVAQINSNLTPTANRALEQLSLAAGDLRALMLRINALAGEIEQDPSTFVYQKPQPVERSH
jgi:phospholipid/cholesterol/gamma-HCH transport system substrate-binding protein